MFLPARLERSTLGDLLGSLHRGRATGRLDLVEVDGAAAGLRRSIHLVAGAVVRVDGSGLRIGERVGLTGAASVAAERALAGRAPTDVRLAGEVLLAAGLVARPALVEALRAQAAERLEGLYALRRADVRFHVAGPGGAAAPRIELGPDVFLHGRPRRAPRATPSPSHDGSSSRAPRSTAAGVVAVESALALLGLDAQARHAPETIGRAFRRRAAALHPDRARDETSRRVLERAFAQLGDAYRTALAATRAPGGRASAA